MGEGRERGEIMSRTSIYLFNEALNRHRQGACRNNVGAFIIRIEIRGAPYYKYGIPYPKPHSKC